MGECIFTEDFKKYSQPNQESDTKVEPEKDK